MKGINMAKKIFFGNYKGGVGKTTSTYNIAVEMAKQQKKKVLIVDLDPQSSLSEVCMSSYGINLDVLPENESLNYVYDINMQIRRLGNINVKINSSKIIKNTNEINFIPNSLFYKNGGLDKISMDIGTNVENLIILRDFIEENNLNEEYDFIFFDCPPSNNIITQSAFLYCDYYIIPTIMDGLSAKGVKHYVNVIEKVYDNYCNPLKNENSEIFKLIFGDKPKLLGIFETMRKANTDTSTYRNQLRADGYYLFKNEIKDRKDVSVTMANGEETNDWEYVRLTEEILQRIDSIN
jgi:cellulose biosynthesis protein BcsQ